MARYKSIKPALKNPKEEQAKKDTKRKKIIFRTFSYVFYALLILGIIITVINDDNNLVFACGNIAMSVIIFFAIAFLVYTEIKGWYKNIVYWEERKFFADSNINKEHLKEKTSENRFVIIFISMILFGLAVYMLIIGIRALYGIR